MRTGHGSEEGVSRFEAGGTPSGHGLDTGVSRGGHSEPSSTTARAEEAFPAKNGKHIDKDEIDGPPQPHVLS